MALPLVAALLFCSSFAVPADGDARRDLHQPLYPIQWTPPPPPIVQDFTDSPTVDSIGFTSGSTPSPPGAVAPARRHSEMVVASAVCASVAALAVLLLSGLFLYRRRLSASPDARRLIGRDDSGIRQEGRRTRAMAPDVLYLGTMDAGAGGTRRSDEVNASPYRKLGKERVLFEMHHPSPQLQPLPPLPPLSATASRRGMVPPQRLSYDKDTYYTKQRSGATATVDSSISSVTRWSLNSEGVEELPVPPTDSTQSQRSFSKTRPSTYSNSYVKSIIQPPSMPTTKPPPPPPPPPPPSRRMYETIKVQTPTPPPPRPPPPPPQSGVSINQVMSKTERPIADRMTPSSRRRLLNPLPAEASTFNPHTTGKLGNGSTLQVGSVVEDLESDAKPKLKPLHWDKVRATSDRAMVWDQLASSSFELNEDMIETLFVNNAASTLPKDTGRKQGILPSKQENRVLDPKRSQNIAILLRVLNVTRNEISGALLDGNTDCLGAALLETLVKMAPTKEEELKLQNYMGDVTELGSAESFLKTILDIPFAFRRVDAMLYRANFESEVKYLKQCYGTLEAACEDLRSSRLFLKLLEAVLRTGNRMNVGTNRGQAMAFKLDTLLKLADVRGTDGKTTLLHFVVQEIVRLEGSSSESTANDSSNIAKGQFKNQDLKLVAELSSELSNVRKAAGMDSDVLSSYVSKLEIGLEKVKLVLHLEKSCTQGMKFFETMRIFVPQSEREIGLVKEDEKRAMNLLEETTEYFHGDATKEESHPLRIFMVVRDFLSMLDNVCKEVNRLHERTMIGSARCFSIPASTSQPVLQRYEWRRGSEDDDSSSS